MRTLLRWVACLPQIAVTVLMIVAMLDMLVGVFLRYVMTQVTAAFDLPSIRFFWVEEIGEWSLAWVTFIGAAIGIRRGTHFAVHMVTDRLPECLRRAILSIHCVLMAGFGVLLVAFGWQVATLNSLSFSPALGVNLWWLYITAVVGGALIACYSLVSLGDVWQARGIGVPVEKFE